MKAEPRKPEAIQPAMLDAEHADGSENGSEASEDRKRSAHIAKFISERNDDLGCCDLGVACF